MTAALARRLLEREADGAAIVSLYLDLDPAQFATAPARATQVSSLMSDARAQAAALEESLDHGAARALRDDLTRLEDYLSSDELPVAQAHALAVFAGGGQGPFESAPLPVAAGPAVHVARGPVIEPIVTAPADPVWCAVLVARDRAEIYRGAGRRILAHDHSADYVRGDSAEGGSTGHNEEQDAENHLIAVAERLLADFEHGRFAVLAIGGPVEAEAGLRDALPGDLRRVLLEPRLEVDPSAAGGTEVADAVGALVEASDRETRTKLLAALADGLDTDRGVDRATHAVAGADAVRDALTEQRVATLLLGSQFADSEREALVQAAVRQDADVVAFADPVPELPAPRPVAALLRF